MKQRKLYNRYFDSINGLDSKMAELTFCAHSSSDMKRLPASVISGRSIFDSFNNKYAHQTGGGGSRRKKLPHRPLVLCSNLPNDHGHFDEV